MLNNMLVSFIYFNTYSLNYNRGINHEEPTIFNVWYF